MVVMHAHVDLGRLQMVVDVLGILRAGSPVVALGTRGLRPVVVVAAELVVGVRVLVGVGEVALRCRGQGQGVAEGGGGQGGLVVVVVVVGVGGVPGFEFGDGAVGGVLVLMFLGGGVLLERKLTSQDPTAASPRPCLSRKSGGRGTRRGRWTTGKTSRPPLRSRSGCCCPVSRGRGSACPRRRGGRCPRHRTPFVSGTSTCGLPTCRSVTGRLGFCGEEGGNVRDRAGLIDFWGRGGRIPPRCSQHRVTESHSWGTTCGNGGRGIDG